MSDLVTFFTAATPIMLGIFAIVRLLLGFWFKQQNKLQEQAERINILELDKLRAMIGSLENQIKNFEMKVDVLTAKIKMNAESAERVIQAQIAFVSSTEKRIKQVEEKVDNVGKVTVKHQ